MKCRFRAFFFIVSSFKFQVSGFRFQVFAKVGQSWFKHVLIKTKTSNLAPMVAVSFFWLF
ncbi:hypothetical protein BOW57_13405 [Flavobacterium sp. YO64]|nr:hypothetical protein BOW57_13405 [Flavobacterium sp. YO64]